MKSNNGVDMVARNLFNATGASGFTGTSTTAPTATTFTCDGATLSASSGGPPQTGGLVGFVVVRAGVYGVIVANTTTVLTIDYWHDPTNPGGAAASTPAAGQWVIVPGGFPAAWLGLSIATRTLAAADAFLTNDGTTVSEIWNAGGGLNRALGAVSHTLGTNTVTVSKTFTSTGSDPSSSTVHRAGRFQHGLTAAPTTTTTGIMYTATNFSSDAIITNNGSDTLTVQITDTIT